MTAALPPEAAGKPVEIWFTDEARVGQQGTLTRVWAKRGSRPRALRDRRFEWAYLFGAICPERGTGAAIIMPEVNVAAMDEHLAEISRRVSVGAIALLVLDGAGWHSSPRLKLPDIIVLLALPRYSPELNPTRQLSQPQCLGRLRRHHSGVLRRLDQAEPNARAHRLTHQTHVGHSGHRLGCLVSRGAMG